MKNSTACSVFYRPSVRAGSQPLIVPQFHSPFHTFFFCFSSKHIRIAVTEKPWIQWTKRLQRISSWAVQNDPASLKKNSHNLHGNCYFNTGRTLRLDSGQCTMLDQFSSGKISTILNPMHSDLCQGYLPLLLAFYDYWYIQRRRPKSELPFPTNGQTFRHLWSAVFLTASYTVKASVMGTPRSTYICPLSSSANSGVPSMQILSILLECYILTTISGAASTAQVDATRHSENPSVAVGCIFTVNW